jgi:GNAT superfamily N-acetyltransferase
VKEIRIAAYDPAYQERINIMMAGIQDEYSEAITTHHSTKIQEVYTKPAQKYWVAVSGEEIAGTIGIVLFDDDKAVLKRMMVDKRFRGNDAGTAAKLMETALEWARQNGAHEVFLGTMSQFEAAQRFYLKNGFLQISENELPFLYPQNPMDTVFFAKKI